ncbi:MAG: hypothetical protein H5T68_08240 [Chloroflexi bacterium]|nr:hypothetical protein [Chloroflexota bacterium]
MSKVTYHEFRPGHWVKLVDGKIVGRATAEEVAAWKREQAAQTMIWQDVVQRTASAEPKPEIPPEKPLPARKASLESVIIWQDVLSQISGTEPRKEGQLREAKVKKETEHIPEKDALKPTVTPQLVSAQPAAKAKPKDGGKPAEQAAKVKPAPTAKTVPAEAVVAKPATKPKPKVEKEATVARKAEDVPAPALEEETRITEQALSVEETVPEVIPQRPRKAEARRTKAMALKQTVRAQVRPEEEAAPPEVEEAEAEAMPQPASTTATRRTAAKPSSIASREQPSQLYLWIMAGASDDLIATVRSGLARYQERFHQPAEVVLCHVDDMAILEKANLPVDVRQGKGVPPRSFWIGLK